MTKLFAKLLHKTDKSEASATEAASQAAIMARMNRVLHIDETPSKAG